MSDLPVLVQAAIYVVAVLVLLRVVLPLLFIVFGLFAFAAAAIFTAVSAAGNAVGRRVRGRR